MSRQVGRVPLLALSLLLPAAGIGLAAMRVGLLESAGGVRLSADWALTDFYSAAYHPARAVLGGATPYTHDGTYPPYAPLHLVLHLPLAWLPPELAGIAYFLWTGLLTLPLAYLALRLSGLEPRANRVLSLAGAVLLSRPGHWSLLLGQVSILLTVATYLALTTPVTNPVLGGAAVAVTLLKLPYGLPLVVLLWAWGRRRIASTGLVLAALINLPLLALFAVREGGVRELFVAAVGGYRSWQDIADVNPSTSNTRSDATSLASRLLGEPLPDLAQVLLAVVILVAAAVVLRRLRSGSGATHGTAVGIICLVVSLIGFHRGYDLVLLTAPFLALAVPSAPWSPAVTPPIRMFLLALFAIPALNWIATESVLAAWHPSRPLWLLVTSANALSVLGLLTAYLLLGARTQGDRGLGVDSPKP